MRLISMLFLIFILTISTYGQVLSVSKNINFPFLRKETTVTPDKDLQIILYLDGMQPLDFVSVLPKEKKFAVTAGIVSEWSEKSGFHSTGELPETSLKISGHTLSFTRPEAEGRVFLHIQIPEGAQVRVVTDGKVLLDEAISNSVGIRNGQLQEGALGVAGTVFLASINSRPNQVQQIGYGIYSVPSSKMQVLQRGSLATPLGRSITVGLEIDTKGNVTHVKVLDNDPPAELENLLKQEWKFAPYLVDGVPVKVVTVMNLSL